MYYAHTHAYNQCRGSTGRLKLCDFLNEVSITPLESNRIELK